MRNHFVDFMRGVAALGVLVCHTSRAVISYYPECWLNSSPPVKSFFEHGKIGVDIFFLISGYIIVFSLNRGSKPQTFLAKRLLRVFVPYLPLAFMLGLVYFNYPSITNAPNGISVNWFKSITLLPVTGDYSLGVAWTLTYEIFFYIIVWLTLLPSLNKIRWLIISLPSAAGLAAILCGRTLEFNRASSFVELMLSPYQWEFLIGCIWAWIGQAFIADLSALRERKIIILTICIITMTLILFPFNITLAYRILLLLFLGMLFALSSVRDFDFVRKTLNLIVVTGSFSYSLYLIHAPIQSIIVRLSLFLNIPLVFVILALTAIPIIISIAYFNSFERLSLRLMKKMDTYLA